MVARTAANIGIGIAVTIILSLAGTVAWLSIAKSQVETSLAEEKAKCARLHGELATCESNESALKSHIRRQNSAVENIHSESERATKKAKKVAEATKKALTDNVKKERDLATDAITMNTWLKSLFPAETEEK